MSKLTLTDLLAFWGAVVSTIALTWNIFRDLGDRSKLKVHAMIGHVVPTHGDKEFLIVTLTNIGRRPIMVAQLAGEWKDASKAGKRAFVMITQNLPKQLNEGESVTELNDALLPVLSNVKRIRAADSFGREWDLPQRLLQKLIRDSSNR